MSATSPSRSKYVRRFGRATVAVSLFCGGLVASGVFSGSVPAASQLCLTTLGCVDTTVLPTVTLPTLPTLPTTTATTVQTSTVTASVPAGTTTAATTTTSAGATRKAGTSTRLIVKTSVRVRGHGAKRVLEMKLQTSKAVRVIARLHRHGQTLASRQFTAPNGSSTSLLRIGVSRKAGMAQFTLTFRTSSGETAQATYRLRLPR